VTGEKMAIVPISTSAIASADNALRGISKIPGGYRAQVRIGAALEMIKGLNVVSVLIRFDPPSALEYYHH
jgi:hypothetical protein